MVGTGWPFWSVQLDGAVTGARGGCADGQQVVLYGPEDGGSHRAAVDWIALSEELRDAEVRGNQILRSLVGYRWVNPVRKLSLAKLCQLAPSPSDGPSGVTKAREVLRNPTRVGLVTTSEGEPLTASRAAGADRPLRIRVNDEASPGYRRWRNASISWPTFTTWEDDRVRAANPSPAVRRVANPARSMGVACANVAPYPLLQVPLPSPAPAWPSHCGRSRNGTRVGSCNGAGPGRLIGWLCTREPAALRHQFGSHQDRMAELNVPENEWTALGSVDLY